MIDQLLIVGTQNVWNSVKEGKRETMKEETMKDKDAAEARGLRQEDSQHSVEVEEQRVYRWKI